MNDLWSHRSLIKKIAVMDLKLRYKSSILGLLWSLLQPLLMFTVLYLVFGNFFNNRSIENYPIFLLVGIVAWGFLDKATSFSLYGITGKPTLVTKVYFPREVLVISACLTALMMSALELVVLAAFMVVLGVIPTATALLFPFILLIEFAMALGLAFAIASLNVFYRDIQWIWAVVMQVGFFATPIIYSTSIFGDNLFSGILKLNPVGIVIEMMRGSLIYGAFPAAADIGLTLATAILALAAGWAIFKKLEPGFAEGL